MKGPYLKDCEESTAYEKSGCCGGDPKVPYVLTEHPVSYSDMNDIYPEISAEEVANVTDAKPVAPAFSTLIAGKSPVALNTSTDIGAQISAQRLIDPNVYFTMAPGLYHTTECLSASAGLPLILMGESSTTLPTIAVAGACAGWPASPILSDAGMVALHQVAFYGNGQSAFVTTLNGEMLYYDSIMVGGISQFPAGFIGSKETYIINSYFAPSMMYPGGLFFGGAIWGCGVWGYAAPCETLLFENNIVMATMGGAMTFADDNSEYTGGNTFVSTYGEATWGGYGNNEVFMNNVFFDSGLQKFGENGWATRRILSWTQYAAGFNGPFRL